jgi:hypothetical protein
VAGIFEPEEKRYPEGFVADLQIARRQLNHTREQPPDVNCPLRQPCRAGRPLRVITCPPECVSATAAVPQIADDLLRRTSRQPWAISGLMQCNNTAPRQACSRSASSVRYPCAMFDPNASQAMYHNPNDLADDLMSLLIEYGSAIGPFTRSTAICFNSERA